MATQELIFDEHFKSFEDHPETDSEREYREQIEASERLEQMVSDVEKDELDREAIHKFVMSVW